VVEIFTKDLGIVSDVAARLGVDVPMAQAALAQYQAAVESGFGQLDDCAVVKVYEARADVEVVRTPSDD
jgi:L-threonate 2-dehydrogenase